MKVVEKVNEVRDLNPKLFPRDKTLINLGRYDLYSKYNAKNLARAIGEKKELLSVPYSTQFFEATIEGKVADYFIKYNDIKDMTDANSSFALEVKNDVERIIHRLQELQYKV